MQEPQFILHLTIVLSIQLDLELRFGASFGIKDYGLPELRDALLGMRLYSAAEIVVQVLEHTCAVSTEGLLIRILHPGFSHREKPG